MNSQWLGGASVGIGVGWLNATSLGIPGWANLLLMGLVMMVALVDAEVIR